MWTAPNIVSIITAGIAAIVSLGTVAYIKMKSSFRDQQDTEIKITNKVNGLNHKDSPNDHPNAPSAETEIVITFNNVEKFASEMTQFKNGKKEGAKPSQIKSLPNFKKNNIKKLHDIKDDNLEDEDSQETHTHYDNALKTNHEGDVIIGDNRKNLVEQACAVVKHMISSNTGLFKKFHQTEKPADIESHGNIDTNYLNNNGTLKFVSKINPVKRTESDKKEHEFHDTSIDFSKGFKPNLLKKTLSENDLINKITDESTNDSVEINNSNNINLNNHSNITGENGMVMQEIDLN